MKKLSFKYYADRTNLEDELFQVGDLVEKIELVRATPASDPDRESWLNAILFLSGHYMKKYTTLLQEQTAAKQAAELQKISVTPPRSSGKIVSLTSLRQKRLAG